MSCHGSSLGRAFGRCQVLHWQERKQLARRKVKNDLLGFPARYVVFRGLSRSTERKLLLTLTLVVDESRKKQLGLKRRPIVVYDLARDTIEETVICESVCVTKTKEPRRTVIKARRGLA
jgi:hypothetical protein